ncbi:MAG: 16S rRNA (guanine(966)-N(2))-methyltransferase RsmD [Burkholderiaceae bacterium]
MAKSQPIAHGAHTVRIVGGRWKRSRLPVAARPGLRPTPDRVRETVFNWLGQDLAGWRCVDVFAGTGALGFEAASRGASDVLLVELDRGLVLQLAQVQQRLQADMVRIQRGDGVVVLQGMDAASVDLVFLDPPFDSDQLDAALRAAAVVVRPNGWVYLEAPAPCTDAMLAASGLAVARHMKAGVVHAHLLRLSPDVPHA